MTPRDAIEAAEVAGTETAYRLQLAREMYEAGRADGYAAGFDAGWRHSEADMAAWWRETGHHLATRPTHAELEIRRWGPGGREHFADPRPGDFPGQGARPRPEPEPEVEATPMNDPDAAERLYRRYQRCTTETDYAQGVSHGARQALSAVLAVPGWDQVPEDVKAALDGCVGRVAENHAAAVAAEREAWQTYTDAQAEATP